MSEHDVILFFLQIAIMLAVALACGLVMRQLALPVVMGELIGGILLGPTVFGALAPHTQAYLFPPAGPSSLGREAIIKLGMLFFLFIAGMQVDHARLRQHGRRIALTSLAGITAPFALGFALVIFLPHLWGTEAGGGIYRLALFMGTALSISALPVIARILLDLNLIKSDIGSVIMASATIDDLIGWSLFAMILSSFVQDNALKRNPWVTLGLVFGLFALMLSVGRWACQRALRWMQASENRSSALIGWMAVLALMAALAAELIGIHGIFGAFLVGVAVAPNARGQNHTHEMVHRFVISFFAPLYFASLGLRANFITNFDLPLVSLILVVACVGKIGGVYLGARLGKLTPRESLAVGFGMNARGAMEMILASVALEHRLIDERVFVALIVMALATSMLSGPVIQRLLPARAADLR